MTESNILDRIHVEIEECEIEIHDLDQKLQALREAADLIRPHYAPDRDSHESNESPRDLSGCSIEKAAERIFRGNNNAWLTAAELATEAIRRGYRSRNSRNPNNNPEKARVSFRIILKRSTDAFERNRQSFRLRTDLSALRLHEGNALACGAK